MCISINDGNRRIARRTDEGKCRQSSKLLRDNSYCCRFNTNTSDQNKDLRASSVARDSNDYGTFVQWLHAHSPFAYSDLDSLVDISTRIVADKTVIIAMQCTQLVLSQLLPWLARTSQT